MPPNILTIPPGGHEAGRRESYIKTLLCAQHVALVKSASDANTYLVSDASDPLQRSLMDLELKDHLLATAAPHAPMPGELCETHHSTRTAVELEGQEPPAGLRSDARAHAW